MELLYLSLKLLRGGHSGRDKHDVGSVDEFAQSPAANVSAVEGFVMSDSLFYVNRCLISQFVTRPANADRLYHSFHRVG